MQTQQIYAHRSNMNYKRGRESDGNVYAMYVCDVTFPRKTNKMLYQPFLLVI